MKSPLKVFITVVATLALASPLYAGGYEKTNTQAGYYHSAGDLLGMPIVSQMGEEVGVIEDVRLDTQSGRIQYITISQNMEDVDVAVPVDALRFEDEQAILLVDTSVLDSAPSPDKLTDANYQYELESYYGAAPIWEEGQDELVDVETRRPVDRNGWDIDSQTNIDSQDNFRTLKIERLLKNRTAY